MSFRLPGAEDFPNSPLRSSEKITEYNATNKSAQSSITCVYQAKVADLCCKVNVTWCKSVFNHCLSITVENSSDQNRCSCKIDLKPWQFWSKKGLKSLEVGEKRVDVFWDFRLAKFSCSPEPCSDYYIAMVHDEEVVLLLGDLKKEAFKRTKSRPSLEEARLLLKEETLFGKKCFCTSARLAEGKKQHDIVIENSLSGPGDPEMWISIDGTVLIRITNLNWRFRGNETVIVNNTSVQIFWDVHDWLFRNSALGRGFFIFKPCNLECASDGDRECKNSGAENNGSSGSCERQEEQSSPTEFCHFLYAWKIE